MPTTPNVEWECVLAIQQGCQYTVVSFIFLIFSVDMREVRQRIIKVIHLRVFGCSIRQQGYSPMSAQKIVVHYWLVCVEHCQHIFSCVKIAWPHSHSLGAFELLRKSSWTYLEVSANNATEACCKWQSSPYMVTIHAAFSD